MAGLAGIGCVDAVPAQSQESGMLVGSSLGDFVSIGIDITQTLAIIIAAIWAYYRFGLFRENVPRGTIAHRITHRILTGSTIHISVTVVFTNTGRVSWVVDPADGDGGYTRIQVIKPITDEELEPLYNQVYYGEVQDYQWPAIDERILEKRVSVGPSPDTAERQYEFIIGSDIETILVYSSYSFRTGITSRRTGVWDASTVYDIA